MNSITRRTAVILTLTCLALAGCGEAGKNVAMVPAPATAGPQSANQVSGTLTIPGSTSDSSAKRAPKYVSAATLGISILTKQGANAVGSSVFSTVPAHNPQCIAVQGGTQCTFTIGVKPGSDDFYLSLYDAEPVNNAIPTSANLLSTVTKLGVAITAGINNVLSFTLGGAVASFTLSPAAVVSAVGQGNATSIPITVIGKDASGETITGSDSAPYANPIKLAVTEPVGNTGHLTFTVNGNNTGATATILAGSDTVTAVYDGNATAPASGVAAYKATITGTTKSFDVAPLFVTASLLDGATFTPASGTTAAAFGFSPPNNGVQGSLDLIAAELGTGATISLGTTSCAGITFTKSGTAPTADPVSQAWIPQIGASPTTSACTFTFSDGTGTTVPVTTTYNSSAIQGSITIP